MSTHRPRVLIIDDDPLYRSLMTTLLRKDYLLAVASNGSEGYQKAMQHPPDIAIIDIKMPGWDGLKTLEEFRKHPILKRVKIIMLTADASKESVISAIRGGASDYVIKTSFSREEFHEKLKRLSNRQISPASKRPNSHNNHSNLAQAQKQTKAEPVEETQIGSEEDIQGMIDCWD